LGVTLSLLLLTPALAASGDLDPTFGDGGATVTPFDDHYGVATAVAMQADGRIVVVGPMHVNAGIASDFGVARYTSAGLLDPSFSGDGRRLIDFAGRYDRAEAVAMQPSGSILVAGSSLDAAVVTRLLPNGSVDRSFANGGHRLIPSMFTASAVALQRNGKIVVAGTDGPDFAVARLRANGHLDPRFGVGGIARTDFTGYGDAAKGLVIDTRGRIVAGGWALVDDQNLTDFALARYRRDGSLDPTFGLGGLVTTDFASWEDGITGIALTPSGSIVAAGQASDFPGTADQSSDVGLARYLPDGSLDTSFGSGGIITTDFGSFFDQAHGVALQPDGKIVVASHRYRDGDRTAAVARYEVDGDLDPSFGDGGIADTGLQVSGDEVGGVIVQTDGRVVSATAATVPDPAGSTFAFLVFRLAA
jgi:uncharacterized delta-60 repeat protein